MASGLTGLLSVPQGYILNFASSATKKITESVAETASTIKKTVEEGKIDGIIDKVGVYDPRCGKRGNEVNVIQGGKVLCTEWF